MNEEQLNEIRRFFWNYKYSKDYDEKLYKEVVRLIQSIDNEKHNKINSKSTNS